MFHLFHFDFLPFKSCDFADAEGNGDSISAAVQAERIALLSNVLAQTSLDTNGNFQTLDPTPNSQQISSSQQRSHSLTPPQLSERRSFLDVPSTHLDSTTGALRNSSNGNRSVHRSQSHFALGQQYAASAETALRPHIPASLNMASLRLHPHYHQQQHQARHVQSSPIYQTPLPQTPSVGVFGQIHPLSVQNEQPHVQTHSSPLLYATGPVNAFGTGRARVVSSPGPGYSSLRGFGNASMSASQCSSESTASSLGSVGSEFEFGFGLTGRGDKDEVLSMSESDSAGASASGCESGIESEGENESTPAIAGPLLPAFLQDFVRSPVEVVENRVELESQVKEASPCKSNMKGDLGVLNLSPVAPSSNTSSLTQAPLQSQLHPVRSATLPLGTNASYADYPRYTTFPQVPRTRNDSGSSSTSSSGASVSGCGSILSTPSLKRFGGLSSLGLGRDGGIWKMDGEESKSLTLKGLTGGSVGGRGYGLRGDVLPLPVGAERKV